MSKNEVSILINYSKHLVHELKTLLAAINCGIGGINDNLSNLITAYEAASTQGLKVPDIHAQQLAILPKGLALAEKAASNANSYLSNFLNNLTDINQYQLTFQCSIKDCLEKAISQFPYKSDAQRTIFPSVLDQTKDFIFIGNESLMINLFINVFTFIIYHTEHGTELVHFFSKQQCFSNELYISVRTIISEENLNLLFDLGYEENQAHFALGFLFNKKLMNAINGNISCDIADNFLKFTLTFPTQRI